MDKGIYTALSGGLARTHELELIANNLANASTVAYKRDTGTFNEYLPELRRPDTAEALGVEIKAQAMFDGRPPGDKSFVELDGVYSDFRQGLIKKTGRPMDLALDGNGFFEVLTPDGVRYTRMGNFKIDREGILVTVDGYPVLSGAQGLPPEDRVIQVRDVVSPEQRVISANERDLHVSEDGIIMMRDIQMNVIAIREFEEPQWLEKTGNAYFRNVDPRNLKNTLSNTVLRQGHLEQSNVNAITEMTRMIEASRSYESNLQTIKIFNEVDGKTVNEIA